MTDQATRVVPAGWYEDPASSAHVRWWNGLAWTEHTTLKPTAPPRPQTPVEQFASGAAATGAAATAAAATGQVTTATGSIHTPETLARIAEARELERQYGISTAEHDIIVRAATNGVEEDATASASAGEYGATGYGASARAGAGHASAGHAQPGHTETGHAGDGHTGIGYRGWRAEDYGYDEEPGTATASSWFIALWPVLTLVAAVAAAYVYFYVTPEPSIAGIPVIAGAVLVPYLLTLLWAALDARRLRANGHRPASPALAVLGPLVYLIVRRVRVAGTGPLVTLIVLTLLAVGGPLAAYLTGAATPATKALEIQQTIRADLVGSGQLASVTCPIVVESFATGSLYTCDGVTPEGSRKVIWVSIDSAEGDFSYALDIR